MNTITYDKFSINISDRTLEEAYLLNDFLNLNIEEKLENDPAGKLEQELWDKFSSNLNFDFQRYIEPLPKTNYIDKLIVKWSNDLSDGEELEKFLNQIISSN